MKYDSSLVCTPVSMPLRTLLLARSKFIGKGEEDDEDPNV